MRSFRICNSRGAQISQKFRKLQIFEKWHSPWGMCEIVSAFQLFTMDFLEYLACSTTCIWYRTRTIHNLSQNEQMQLELCPKMSPKIINNFDPMLTHFARWCPKSRAKCRITLRDKLYESLGESDLLSDRARSAAKTPNFSPKSLTKIAQNQDFR